MKAGILTPREPAIDLIRIISEGTYTSFAQSLKEFISNSFDADAKEVIINIDEDINSIIIKDNGVGMTLKDFQEFFASIARSGKAGAKTTYGRTKLGRLKIGRFGIGALAVAGIAKQLTVKSTKNYSNEGFEASIDLEKLRNKFWKGEDLSKHWRFNYKAWQKEPKSIHFTQVQIDGINENIRHILSRPGEKTSNEFFETTVKLSGIEELIWQLGIICPVPYELTYPLPQNYLNNQKDKLVFNRSKQLLKNQFKIFLNGKEIRRPVVLPSYHPNKLKNETEKSLLFTRDLGYGIKYVRSHRNSPILFEGYFLVQATKLYPEELRGLLIRLREVAIGWHRTFNISAKGLTTMMTNISGEIWVQDLEDALQFDRESFREDHPKFIWLRDRIVEAIQEEEKEFRKRSEKRTKEKNKLSGKKIKKPIVTQVPKKEETYPDSESYLPSSIFDRLPEYITRIIPQINGCWDRQYYEACSVMIRRLIETLIIHLYYQHKWQDELKDSSTGGWIGLKAMIGKICADSRFSLERKIQDGLKQVKEIGDIGAHDFRIKVRRSDLAGLKNNLRYTVERLIYKITIIGP